MYRYYYVRSVLSCLDKCNLEETKITKFQTGGPDGDLGSNEIKISHDTTIALVDGSGLKKYVTYCV